MIIVEKSKCCGCRACLQICPKKAISTYYDKYGFEQIMIDEQKCVHCNKCKTVCPILNPNKNESRYSCGSAYSKDSTIKQSGASGGLFGEFARQVIEDGGVVYGAAFDNNLQLKTTRASSLNQLYALYKSKYLLCDTSTAFSRIKKDLDNNTKVMYCSSPCQIAALRNYLHNNYTNLLCVEFVCHGVGSQKHFADSISYVEKKKGIKILKYRFREKYKNASSHYYSYKYKNQKNSMIGIKRDIYMTFPYYYAYQERINCRDSCYDCVYATETRTADITIGDFHDILKYEPKVDRFAGVSMFVCNTNVGQEFFDRLKDRLIIKEYDWNTIKINNRFSGTEQIPNFRSNYLELIASNQFERANQIYLNYKKDWRYYYYHTPKIVRDIGNKILRRK